MKFGSLRLWTEVTGIGANGQPGEGEAIHNLINKGVARDVRTSPEQGDTVA